MTSFTPEIHTRRVLCSLCGTEIGPGECCWVINGAVICGQCLPEYARQDYRPCRRIVGEEERL
ncbi:hypothetical protein [Dysosmobacter sp. HCP28S3_G4]|uniref:hypothetical protein n=1 Tax=Dysosmobacter sp. HCP28S3_G4 TaxID=3438938 RepID=UPI003F88B40E|nr:hypothetical protein [Dysosmobacter sp.]